MSVRANPATLITTGRLLFSLALLTSLIFNLGSLVPAQMTNFNLICGDSTGLIKAINQANKNNTDETITLNADSQVNCVYSLTSPDNTTDGDNGLPSITSQITIEGQGAIIERSRNADTPSFRIFHVALSGHLTLNQVTVSNGRATKGSLPANAGGGIANFGKLSLVNCIVSGNDAANGGGLFNDARGTLSLTHSAVSYNSQASLGGGIFNQGTLSLAHSIVNGNSADLSGGGIANFGTLSLTQSIVSHNGQPSLGGGIFNQGTLSLVNSTISGNSVSEDGGGIFNDFGQAIYLTDSTISDNRAKGDAGGLYNHYQGTLSLTDSTVSNNRTSGKGGGIFNRSYAALSLTHSTVGDNRAAEDGGGIANFGSLSLIKSAVRGNRAGHNGGGIFNNLQALSLADSTVSRNSAAHSGGGIFNRGELFLTNSIVTNNPSGGNCTSSGTLYSVNNLIGDGSCNHALSEIKSNREDPGSPPLMDH